MKVLFKNITKYTKANRNRFIEFHSKKFGKKQLIKTFLIAIVFLYICLTNII